MPEETSTASGSGSAEEKPCSSTAAAETSSDVMEEAKKLIGTGKRHLVMGDVVSAVNVFQEACSMLAAKYGDTADECGEAFFLCGKSLLELARMENGVLGNALEGVPEESEEEEQPKNPNLESADNIDDEDDDDDEDDEENNAQDNEEEDVGNLQLAWEMLEVAKVIFKRKESKDDQLMAAQAYLKLGEVSAETGNYPQALEDFQECLTLQLKLLPPHCRLLAETHYHVATTLVSMDQYNQAIQHYNSSVKVIETRLAMLQEVIDAAAGDDAAAAAAEEKNELEELKQLLPEIREKVEDAKESQRTASAASQAIQQTLGNPSTSSTFPCENGGPSSSAAFASTSQIPVKTSESATSSKAVSDISHLVRKKRKPEEESPVKDTDAKQLKQEATVNGSGDSSASNGSETQEGKSKEASDRPVLPRLLNSGKRVAVPLICAVGFLGLIFASGGIPGFLEGMKWVLEIPSRSKLYIFVVFLPFRIDGHLGFFLFKVRLPRFVLVLIIVTSAIPKPVTINASINRTIN